NGSTLMATSRSSCFSRALKTIAMPPRPSSSRISYSSLSCDRTSSSSVSSWWSWIGVAARSKPQERQNLLASSFWVPQREQYIVLRGVAESYGRIGGGVNRLWRDTMTNWLMRMRDEEDVGRWVVRVITYIALDLVRSCM